jgi:hypothetical protein
MEQFYKLLTLALLDGELSSKEKELNYLFFKLYIKEK